MRAWSGFRDGWKEIPSIPVAAVVSQRRWAVKLDTNVSQPWQIALIKWRRRSVTVLVAYPRLECKWENHLVAPIPGLVQNGNLHGNLCPLGYICSS